MHHADLTLEAHALHAELDTLPLEVLLGRAESLTLAHHGRIVTYSRKIFIPLTQLCRDVCHYCTFAQTPSRAAQPYLDMDAVLSLARAGAAAGCHEALFTLGDRPEARYAAARHWLDAHGYESTLAYMAACARSVIDESGLLPHFNPGVLSAADYAVLRPLSASMGLMLESASVRLCAAGMPHHGSPDKAPDVRLRAIALAGEAQVPFTTGLLIGIGETRLERIEALLAIRDLHRRHGHIQEVIIQNFRAKPGTRMQQAPEPSLDEHLWSIAAARLILGPSMTIQAPPNLRPGVLPQLLRAGVNDWGGVSPVTPDHVNPEAPWPHLEKLETETGHAGRLLRQRLAIGPAYAQAADVWADAALRPAIRRVVDSRGLVREDAWCAGRGDEVPDVAPSFFVPEDARIHRLLDDAARGQVLAEDDIAHLFTADGSDVDRICALADDMRAARVGDAVTYVVNRNINYTNMCQFKCGFCAFSKGSTRRERGPAYDISYAEIADRAREARQRGATEVCLQGGIHPRYDGNTYRDIISAVKAAVPDIHCHAFSPLEVHHGATTLGMSYAHFLQSLKGLGLATLPGTAAEILSDDVRDVICPDKITTAQWLAVMRAAHGVGLRSTATIMFGHVEGPQHWAAHLCRVRDLQLETGGFTEFVPLPFVHMEAPLWRKGLARSGPTWREVRLMHAVSRIALDGVIPNIQASWVKLGLDGAAAMLQCGANDVGGILMDESITRAAGGVHGQQMDVATLRGLAGRLGRPLVQRSTLYAVVQEHDRFDSCQKVDA